MITHELSSNTSKLLNLLKPEKDKLIAAVKKYLALDIDKENLSEKIKENLNGLEKELHTRFTSIGKTGFSKVSKEGDNIIVYSEVLNLKENINYSIRGMFPKEGPIFIKANKHFNKFLENFWLKNNKESSKEVYQENVNIYNGKLITYTLGVKINFSSYYSIVFTTYHKIEVTVNPTKINYFKSISLAREGDSEYLKSSIKYCLSHFWHTDFLPISFDYSLPFGKKELKKLGIVKLNDTFFYLPYNGEELCFQTNNKKEIFKYDNRDALINKALSSETPSVSSIGPNRLIGIETTTERLIFTDANGAQANFDLSLRRPATKKDVLRILKEKVITIFLTGKKFFSISRYIDDAWKDFIEEEKNIRRNFSFSLKNNNTADSISYLNSKSFDFGQRSILPLLKKDRKNVKTLLGITGYLQRYITSHVESIPIVNTLFALGILRAIEDNITGDNLDKIIDLDNKLTRDKEKFNKATEEEMPPVQFLSENALTMSHQAWILAKLDIASDYAIIDVSTGGGKTFIIINDILNLIRKGKVKRPLIVMPNSLCGQFAGEVIKFTDGRVNPFVINTATVNSYGDDAIWENAKNAPLNTIFITSYSYLASDKTELDKNIYVYNSVKKFNEILKIDAVTLDESHYIKNPMTNYYKAVCGFNNVKVKRIATGTLLTNNPYDLLGQLGFLDPNILGGKKEFESEFASDGNPKNGWITSIRDSLRKKLDNNTFYISCRENAWGQLLPSITYEEHFVDMTPNQKSVYKILSENIYKELNSKELKNIWEEFEDNYTSNFEFDEIPQEILPKIQVLEQFICSPSSITNEKLLKGKTNSSSPILGEQDKVSCKSRKIDELIGKSISKGQKVIIGTHYKESARSLIENSKYKDISIYYDASTAENIVKFKEDENVKVMFCVLQSLAEGHNLQVADRIIIADVDWTPGKLTQFIARIYRPSLKKDENGNTINANNGKKIYIDTILANNSIDVFKWASQVNKKIVNSGIMENCSVEQPGQPPFNEKSFVANINDTKYLKGSIFLEANKKYNEWKVKRVEEAKKNSTVTRFLEPKREDIPSNWDVRKIPIPVVTGMYIPKDTQTIEKVKKNNITEEPKKGRGRPTKVKEETTEVMQPKKGRGRPPKIQKNEAQQPVQEVIIPTPEKPAVKEQPQENTFDDKKINLEFFFINGDPGICTSNIESVKKLWGKGIGLKKARPMWVHEVKNEKDGLKVLEKIKTKFKVDEIKYNNCIKVVESVNSSGDIPTNNIYKIFSNISNFYRIKENSKPSKDIKLYPMVRFNNCMLVADKEKVPNTIGDAGFKIWHNVEPLWYLFVDTNEYDSKTGEKKKVYSKNKDQFLKLIKDIQNTGLEITNLEELMKTASKYGC